MRASDVGLVASVALMAAISPLHAQKAMMPSAVGPIEAGVFGQVDWLDKAMQTDRVGWGLGGRLGWFFNRNWELEGEGSFSRANPNSTRIQTGNVQINYYIGRLNYNMAMGSGSVVLGVGGGEDAIDDHSDFILSPLLGVRIPIADDWHVRIDASMMFAPNPASATYKYVPLSAGGVNDGAAYLTNGQLRVGISYLPWTKRPPAVVSVGIQPRNASIQLVCAAPTVSFPLSANVTRTDGAVMSQAVMWRSDNPSVVQVDRNTGMLTAYTAGSANITAVPQADTMASDRVSVTVRGTTTSVIRGRVDTTWKMVTATAVDTAIFFQTDSPKVARGARRHGKAMTQEEMNMVALRDTARATLDGWISFLKANPSVTLTISGYADIRWKKEYNKRLSQRRADAAAEYMKSNGIDPNRIKAVIGNGETTEYGAGRSKAALQRNRRDKVTIDVASNRVVDTINRTADRTTCQP
jgi:OmpA family/Outer membrane protein beta-barrel domain/Bacterial Ig-like domain (group 2)